MRKQLTTFHSPPMPKTRSKLADDACAVFEHSAETSTAIQAEQTLRFWEDGIIKDTMEKEPKTEEPVFHDFVQPAPLDVVVVPDSEPAATDDTRSEELPVSYGEPAVSVPQTARFWEVPGDEDEQESDEDITRWIAFVQPREHGMLYGRRQGMRDEERRREEEERRVRLQALDGLPHHRALDNPWETIGTSRAVAIGASARPWEVPGEEAPYVTDASVSVGYDGLRVEELMPDIDPLDYKRQREEGNREYVENPTREQVGIVPVLLDNGTIIL